MKKNMIAIAFITLALSILFTILHYINKSGITLTFSIIFSTTAYHFWMRLIVGYTFNFFMNNKADYTKKWYQIKNWEKKLYKTLKVKKWKNHMPTFNPDLFDADKHSLDEIAQAMCQSELVHETIIILSFLPITLTIWFGDFPVFLITSILSALFDLSFVIMQRYNRPRIVKLIKRKYQ